MPVFDVTRGDTAEFEIVISADGDPSDLSSCKIWFTGKHHVEDSDADALWSLNSVDNPTQVIIGTPTTDGKVTLVLHPADTENLPLDRKVSFDVQWKETGGKVFTVYRGTMNVLPDVTRSRA
jgi:hypothetical protein